MAERGRVFFQNHFAGVVEQSEGEYRFTYDSKYIAHQNARPISLTMPLQKEPFVSKTMLPFFDGLIPEGWLLGIAVRNWKVDPKNRMKLLLTLCRDCVGAVHVVPDEETEK